MGYLPSRSGGAWAELNDRVGESQFCGHRRRAAIVRYGLEPPLLPHIRMERRWRGVVLPEKDSPAAQRLIGSTVKVRGVAGSHMDAANRRVGAQLFVNSLEDIEVQELAAPVFPSSRAGHPLQTVQQIHNLGNAGSREVAPGGTAGCGYLLRSRMGLALCFAIEPAQSISTCMATTKRIRQARQCSWDGVTSAGDVSPNVAQPANPDYRPRASSHPGAKKCQRA